MNYPYTAMNPYTTTPNTQPVPHQVACVEPYVVAALMSQIGKKLVIETVRGSLTGTLMDVKPDHIILGQTCDDSRFFIRLAGIVHIMPID